MPHIDDVLVATYDQSASVIPHWGKWHIDVESKFRLQLMPDTLTRPENSTRNIQPHSPPLRHRVTPKTAMIARRMCSGWFVLTLFMLALVRICTATDEPGKFETTFMDEVADESRDGLQSLLNWAIGAQLQPVVMCRAPQLPCRSCNHIDHGHRKLQARYVFAATE